MSALVVPLVFLVLTLTENVGESITEKGQEPIVQVSLIF